MDFEDVLDAKIVSSEQISSNVEKILDLTWKFSVAASITKSHDLREFSSVLIEILFRNISQILKKKLPF